MNDLFSKHEAKYMSRKIEGNKPLCLCFNGKWLICNGEDFTYADNPFHSAPVVKSVK